MPSLDRRVAPTEKLAQISLKPISQLRVIPGSTAALVEQAAWGKRVTSANSRKPQRG
ncbi:hypothetical protein [Gluconobacter wancherniae]|uniref:hypothetical protein n=1 Tax=Gluconobacter wancherniae TaxID=1307955 RepID=UPI001B8C69A7|nr:hypothetical protein [Gluconobacter wancherniae]MBS1089808.1 hypothetical protein [Gluconobacter wancherniae]